MTARHAITIAIALMLAVLLQARMASSITVWLARPDFVTVTIVCLALLTGFRRATIGGLCGGFLFAALCGANFGSFMVSRSVAGGLLGKLPRSVQRDNAYVPTIAVFIGTIVAEVVYFIMSPASPVGWWTKMLLAQAVYNTIITLPVYWLLQRALGKPKTSFAPYRR